MDWSGKVPSGNIAHMVIRFLFIYLFIYWRYYDGHGFSLVFKLCANMDLLGVYVKLWVKCDGYSNLVNYNYINEWFDEHECKSLTCFQ